MLNKVKTKALISVGAVAATSFILMMGYTAGQHSTAKQSRKEIELAAAKLVEDKQAEDKASILSSDTVKEFLTQHYTKEKLGEKNTRIQSYMTESAFSQELTSQNDAMNQVYKDYILDYHFDTNLEEHLDIHRSKHIRNLTKGQSASPEKSELQKRMDLYLRMVRLGLMIINLGNIRKVV